MKNYLILNLILLLTFQSYSQGLQVDSELPVNIDANGTSPHQSAMLDVKSTNKGVLIPRMTTSQRNNINSPATGLLVFDTNTKGFWFFDGSTWKDLSSSSTLSELPFNPQSGEMVYYDGSDWVSILPGTTGQKLCYCDGVPTWGPCGPTCSDGIQNQGEQGIDCGGPCLDCPCSCPGNITITRDFLSENPFSPDSPCEIVTFQTGSEECIFRVRWVINGGGINFNDNVLGNTFTVGTFTDFGFVPVSAIPQLIDGTFCPTITSGFTLVCRGM